MFYWSINRHRGLLSSDGELVVDKIRITVESAAFIEEITPEDEITE